jgi:hypothetical protein
MGAAPAGLLIGDRHAKEALADVGPAQVDADARDCDHDEGPNG